MPFKCALALDAKNKITPAMSVSLPILPNGIADSIVVLCCEIPNAVIFEGKKPGAIALTVIFLLILVYGKLKQLIGLLSAISRGYYLAKDNAMD